MKRAWKIILKKAMFKVRVPYVAIEKQLILNV